MMPQCTPIVARRDHEILHDVLIVATQVMLAPAAAFGHRQKLEALRTEVQAAIARPAPDGRFIDDIAGMLMTAALKISGLEWKEPRWLQLAAFLLPLIREDWRRALEREIELL
jgi:hypothetical protein